MRVRKNKSYLATLARLGISVEDAGDEQYRGVCPFCGDQNKDDADHFYIHEMSGQWDCKKCGARGNMFSFLTKLAAKFHRQVTETEWTFLSRNRGIPSEAFKLDGIGFNLGQWWLPVKSETGMVRDMPHWTPEGKMITLDGCETQLWGAEELVKAPAGAKVWVCEGRWDGPVWRWLLWKANKHKHVVVAVPGANTFKDQWVEWFKKKSVILCYDNDTPGDNGAERAAEKLEGTAADIKYLCWPESLPSKWDLRDQVKSGLEQKKSPQDIYSSVNSIVRSKHRRASSGEKKADQTIGPPISFEKLIEMQSKWVEMQQDLKDGWAVSLATCLGNEVSGEPLWIYLVGPPASGKTLILLSLQTAERCVFRSTITPAGLVSGFNTHPDPSLLPKLDGRTAIFKDGTELLAMHQDARREAFSTLRGAYDGFVSKSFGNGVIREYKLHFNMLVGITPAIHADNQATMGERFLKFEIREDLATVEAQIRAAASNLTYEEAMSEDMQEACNRFLNREVDDKKLPMINEDMMDRIVALSRMLGMLRAKVERTAGRDPELAYRPTYELGTRIAKQMCKMARLLAFVYGLDAVDESVYRVIKKLAIDSSIGYHMDIVRNYMRDGNPGRSLPEVASMSRIPIDTCRARFKDLESLNVLRPLTREESAAYQVSQLGLVPARWKVSQLVVSLWQRSMAKGGPKTPIRLRNNADANGSHVAGSKGLRVRTARL